jgi:hemolysin activation/secretion protein
MRGRGLMLVAGMRAGERRAEASQQQQQQAQQAQQQAYQQGMQAQATQAPAPTAAPAKDVTAELQKLADLHKSGVLNDQEFAAAKAKLLG